MAKLRHAKVVASERKDSVRAKEIDQQIDKLKALESLRKEKDVVYGQLEETDDIEGARKLRDQLKHAQAEYDAEYESFTADDIND